MACSKRLTAGRHTPPSPHTPHARQYTVTENCYMSTMMILRSYSPQVLQKSWISMQCRVLCALCKELQKAHFARAQCTTMPTHMSRCCAVSCVQAVLCHVCMQHCVLSKSCMSRVLLHHVHKTRFRVPCCVLMLNNSSQAVTEAL